MGWAYWLSIGLSVAGLVDAVYLTWLKVSGDIGLCLDWGQCDVVNASPYSEIYGIPIALLGAGAYATMLVLLLIEGWKRAPQFLRTLAPYAVFTIALAGTLYSAYLTYIEIVVLQAICPFCVLSALFLTALLVLSAWRLHLLAPQSPAGG